MPSAPVTFTDRDDWLEQRRKSIGGSDAGTIMGVNKWKSPYDLWCEKVHGTAEDRSEFAIGGKSEAAFHGTNLEDYVGYCFTLVTGKELAHTDEMLVTDKYGFPMSGNLDFNVVDEPSTFLECKTGSIFGKTQWANDRVPAPYLYQVLHYMEVFDRTTAYVAVLLGGQRFEWREVHRENHLWEIADMVERERAFWTMVEYGEWLGDTNGND